MAIEEYEQQVDDGLPNGMQRISIVEPPIRDTDSGDRIFDEGFYMPSYLHFNVPLSPYNDGVEPVNPTEKDFTEEWINFTNTVMTRTKYIEDDTGQVLEYTDERGEIQKTSYKMMRLLALLQKEFAVTHSQNPLDEAMRERDSMGLPKGQDDEFHHLLRTAVFSAREEGGEYDYLTIDALCHPLFQEVSKKLADGFTYQPERELQESITAYRREKLTEILGPKQTQKVEAHSLWVSFLDGVSQVATDEIIDHTKMARRFEKVMEFMNNNFSTEVGDIEREFYELLDSPLHTAVENYRGEVLFRTVSMLMRNIGEAPLLTMAAKITDNLQYKRTALYEENKNGEISQSVLNHAREAHFVIMGLEFVDRQRELKRVKDLTYRILEPEKMMALDIAMRKLDNYLEATKIQTAANIESIKQVIANRKFTRINEQGEKVEYTPRLVSKEIYEQRDKVLREKYSDFAEYAAHLHELLGPEEYYIQMPRKKGPGSMLLKLKLNGAAYHRAVSTYIKAKNSKLPVAKHEPEPEMFSARWFELTIPLLTDLWACKIIKGESQEEQSLDWETVHNDYRDNFVHNITAGLLALDPNNNFEFADPRKIKNEEVWEKMTDIKFPENPSDDIGRLPMWIAESARAAGHKGYDICTSYFNRKEDNFYTANVSLLMNGMPMEMAHQRIGGKISGDQGDGDHTYYKGKMIEFPFDFDEIRRKTNESRYKFMQKGEEWRNTRRIANGANGNGQHQ